jgi:hypothetical protein
MNLNPNEKIVAAGTFVYGDTECELRVVLSPVRYGSGDYEDDPEIAGDFVADTYYVQYGSVTQKGIFNAGGGGYPSLAEARAAAESAPGIGLTIRWYSGAA